MLGSVILTGLLAIVQSSGADAQRRVCCPDIECFSAIKTGKKIFTSPKCPPDIAVTFYFYKRDEHVDPYLSPTWPDVAVEASQFDVNKPTMIFINDHHGLYNNSLVQGLKDAYLEKVDSNAIIVGWNAFGTYEQSVADAEVVAAQIASFIDDKITNLGAQPDTFHLIGFGVGGHIAGFVGRRLNGTLRMITALDPSGPIFTDERKRVVHKGDARFVEVAHTNCHPLSGIGMADNTGDVDFFFNDGMIQPDCPLIAHSNALYDLALNKFNAFFAEPDHLNMTCSHNMALTYYTDSLKNTQCTYWGRQRNLIRLMTNVFTNGFFAQWLTFMNKCSASTCSPFGLETSFYPARGAFDVATQIEPPYCLSYPKIDIAMRKYMVDNQEQDSVSEQEATSSLEITSQSEVQVETTTQTT